MRTPGGLEDRSRSTAPDGPVQLPGRPRPYGRPRPPERPAQPPTSTLDGGDQPPAPPPPRRSRWRGGATIGAALLATAALAYWWGSGRSEPAVAPPPVIPSASPTPPTTAEIYATVAPSVVSVVVTDAAGGASSGTGVVVNAEAMILTALHVVNEAAQVRVVFADGTDVAATVVGADPAMDIAVLAPQGLPAVVVPAVLGASQPLEVGDTVIAIGDQLGLTRTATEGVVSGLGRTAPGSDGGTITGLIQFDAAVNHGSSGGPLVNDAGETVGIVVALANPTTDGTFIGIGFAVPIGAAVTAGGGPPLPR